MLHFYFADPYVSHIIKDAKLTLVGKLSSIGGTLGLLTGFSVVSLYEIAYLAIRLLRRMRSGNNNAVQ